MKEEFDCTTCRFGYVDERLGIPFCHKSKECGEWTLYEPKEEIYCHESHIDKDISNDLAQKMVGQIVEQIDDSASADRIVHHFPDATKKVLTWQDISRILDLDREVDADIMVGDLPSLNPEEYCEEILKRFNEQR